MKSSNTSATQKKFKTIVVRKATWKRLKIAAAENNVKIKELADVLINVALK